MVSHSCSLFVLVISVDLFHPRTEDAGCRHQVGHHGPGYGRTGRAVWSSRTGQVGHYRGRLS